MDTKNKQIENTERSKYEFNMAEFPTFLLSSNRLLRSKIPTSLTYEDTINGENNSLVKRSWKVFTLAEYGWGSPQLLSLVVDLMKICKEQGFSSSTIRFESVYNLIKRLGLKNNTEVYKRIRHDLDALVGYTFKAKNAFLDNEKKAYVDMTGHFFEYVNYYHRESNGKQQPLPYA